MCINIKIIRICCKIYGSSIHSGDRPFYVPDNYPLKASGSGVDKNGRKFIRVKGVRWFTNLDHGRRHQPLSLMSMADTDSIPKDYKGIMGVPVTFLNKFNPDQFEIIGCGDYKGTYGSDYLGIKEIGTDWLKKYRSQGGKGHYTANMNSAVYYLPDGTAKPTFKRIFIKVK